MESLFSTIFLLLLVSLSFSTSSEALTSSKGDVNMKWDIMSFTPDGYVAVVTAYNNQNDSIPGWTISWEWTKKEVIWSMVGAKTLEEGDCSMYKGNVPNSCVRNPAVIDLIPDVPFDQQIANCCKNGFLSPGSESAFLVAVGNAGNSVKTAQMPVDFTLSAPEEQYICGQAKNVRPTRFFSAHTKLTTSALMTWNITCDLKKAA